MGQQNREDAKTAADLLNNLLGYRIKNPFDFASDIDKVTAALRAARATAAAVCNCDKAFSVCPIHGHPGSRD